MTKFSLSQLKLNMFQAVQEMICMGVGYGLSSGEWVKALLPYNLSKMNGKNRKIRRLSGNSTVINKIMLHVYYFYLHINLCSPAINGCHCPVSSARRTLVYPAVGRRFKPWSDQQPGPLKSGKIMLNNLIFQPDFTIIQCIWSCLTFPCFPAKHSAVLKEQLAVYLK